MIKPKENSCNKLIFLFYLLFSYLLFAQSPERQRIIDSLSNELQFSEDTTRIELLNELATNYRGISGAPQRLLVAREALLLADKLEHKEGYVASLNNIGLSHYYMRNLDSALIYYKKCVPIFRELKDSVGLGGIYSNIGNTYERQLLYDSANFYHKKSMQMRAAINDSAGVATSKTNIGLNYWRKGENQKALDQFHDALSIRRKVGNLKSIAASLNNIGTLHWRWGNYYTALNYYLESLKLKRQVEDYNGVILTQNNIGLIYLDTNDPHAAKNYFLDALNGAQKLNYSFGITYSKANLGDYYAFVDSFQTAIPYYEESITDYYNYKDINGVINYSNKLGEVYLELGNNDKALGYFEQALNESEKSDDKYGLVHTLINLGVVKRKTNRINESLKDLMLAERLAKDEKLLTELSRIYYELYLLHKVADNFNTALKYLENHSELSDSLLNEQKFRAISDIKARYELDQKEQENRLLRQQNSIQELEIRQRNEIILITLLSILAAIIIIVLLIHINRVKQRTNEDISKRNEEVERLNENLNEINERLKLSEKRLKQNNAEKDKFFSIVAHDLKNPFNAILGYIQILNEEFDDLDVSKKKKYVSEISNSAIKLHELLDNILIWSRAQTQGITVDKKTIDIKDRIDDAFTLFHSQATMKQIKLLNTVNENTKGIFDEFMFDTVMRNLLSNAIKFSEEGGEVKISSDDDQERIKIMVEDNGIGISENDIKRIFVAGEDKKSIGQSREKGTGLGLILCKEFVELNGGKISVDSKLNDYTKFCIEINKA